MTENTMPIFERLLRAAGIGLVMVIAANVVFAAVGPNDGRMVSPQFLATPGEISVAKGDAFEHIARRYRPCGVPDLASVQYKRLPDGQYLYSCVHSWPDNTAYVVSTLLIGADPARWVQQSAIAPKH